MSKRDGMVLTMLDVFTLCARECAVQMIDALRRQAGETCDQLIGAKRDPQAMIAGILVMESAGNVLNAFNRMQSAADGVQRANVGAADYREPQRVLLKDQCGLIMPTRAEKYEARYYIETAKAYIA